MPVNVALGHVSNAFMIAALVIYSLSVVAFAGDFAFGRPRRAAAAASGQQTRDRAAELAAVGAASGPAPAEAGDAAGPGRSGQRARRGCRVDARARGARAARDPRRPAAGWWRRWRSPR